jgi:hypothetical protein
MNRPFARRRRGPQNSAEAKEMNNKSIKTDDRSSCHERDEASTRAKNETGTPCLVASCCGAVTMRVQLSALSPGPDLRPAGYGGRSGYVPKVWHAARCAQI